MLTIQGTTLGEVFTNLVSNGALDDHERSAVSRMAEWFAAYEAAVARRTEAVVETGDRDACDRAEADEARLAQSRPFIGDQFSTRESFSLICGDVKFTIRQHTAGATMNVGIDRTRVQATA